MLVCGPIQTRRRAVADNQQCDDLILSRFLRCCVLVELVYRVTPTALELLGRDRKTWKQFLWAGQRKVCLATGRLDSGDWVASLTCRNGRPLAINAQVLGKALSRAKMRGDERLDIAKWTDEICEAIPIWYARVRCRRYPREEPGIECALFLHDVLESCPQCCWQGLAANAD